MIMRDNKCEVCGVNEPLGVASTILPYSCAYCVECLQRNAQPMVVFETLYDDFGTRFDSMMEGLPDELLAYVNGDYVTYREWAKQRAGAEII